MNPSSLVSYFKKHERAIYLLFTIMAFAFYLLFSITSLNRASAPNAEDTVPYLKLALKIKNMGGPISLLRACFSGVYDETNRQPLYPLLLSGFARPDFYFFTHAKMLTSFFSVMLLLIYAPLVSRLSNVPVAVASLALLCLSMGFLRLSNMVAVESLLTLFLFLCWYFMMKGVEDQKQFLWAGAFCGFAYLVKASALFFLGGYLIAGFLCYRLLIFRQPYFWGFFLTFALVSSPVLARNVLGYHSLFYNANGNIMWLDTWDQYYLPAFMASPESFTLAWYLKTHTIKDIVDRLFLGAFDLWKMGVHTSLPITAWRIRSLIFTCLCAGFVSACVLENRRRLVFIICVLGAYLGMFSWFAGINVEERFLVPLLPIFYALGCWGLWQVMERVLKDKMRTSLLFASMLLLFMLWSAVDLFRQADLRDPREAYEVKGGYFTLVHWFGSLPEDSPVFYGPSHSYPDFYIWGLDKRNIRRIPRTESMAELNDYLKTHEGAYIVIDHELWIAREMLHAFFSYDSQKGLQILATPPGWQLLFADEGGTPPDYLVFKLSPA